MNKITPQEYSMVNTTNSNPSPVTATGSDSDAVFRGSHAAATPANPMKGGYTYKKHGKRSHRTRMSKKSSKRQTISSVLGMDVSYSSKAGGSKKRRRPRRRTMSRQFGMTLARGYAGGRRRRRHSRSNRRLRGGLSSHSPAGFPTGYSTGGPLNHNLSYLATPTPYTAY